MTVRRAAPARGWPRAVALALARRRGASSSRAPRLLGGDEPPADGRREARARRTRSSTSTSRTDGDRDAVERASELLGGFGSYAGQRDAHAPAPVGRASRRSTREGRRAVARRRGGARARRRGHGDRRLARHRRRRPTRARRASSCARNPRRPAVRALQGRPRSTSTAPSTSRSTTASCSSASGRTVQGALDRSNGRGEPLDEDPTYRQRDAPSCPTDRVGRRVYSIGRRAAAPARPAGRRHRLARRAARPAARCSAVADRRRGAGRRGRSSPPGRCSTRQAEASAGDADSLRARRSSTPSPQDALAYLGVSGDLGRARQPRRRGGRRRAGAAASARCSSACASELGKRDRRRARARPARALRRRGGARRHPATPAPIAQRSSPRPTTRTARARRPAPPAGAARRAADAPRASRRRRWRSERPRRRREALDARARRPAREVSATRCSTGGWWSSTRPGGDPPDQGRRGPALTDDRDVRERARGSARQGDAR